MVGRIFRDFKIKEEARREDTQPPEEIAKFREE